MSDTLTDPRAIDVEPADEQELTARRIEQFQMFGMMMARQRDEWVRARRATGVDTRWKEDIDQYEGRDTAAKMSAQMMESVEQGYPITANKARPHRSTVYINLTRNRTNSAESRVADILLPTDDRNWGIKPTPKPSVMRMTKTDAIALHPITRQPMTDPRTGAQLTHKDIAQTILEDARRKASAMQDQIDDDLVEADYNGEMRKVIHNAAVFGTGVIQGPVAVNRTRKAWLPVRDPATGRTIQVLEIVEEQRPASFSRDPRNIYPDPACGDNIHNGKGIYDRELMTGKQVRELAKQPGYLKDQIRKVLEEGPQASATMTEASEQEERDAERSNFEVWTYWGEVDVDDLRAAGLDYMLAGEDGDVLRSVSVCLVLVNSTVIKAFINPLETGDIPYDFYNWEKKANSVWGYGVPYVMRSQQRVLNAAWRQMMDNAGATAGGQVIIKRGAVEPADQQWELTSRKVWWAMDDVDDVRKVFTIASFDSRQKELAAIIELAERLTDQETGVPQIMGGEKGTAPDTVGGMQLLMNSANVVLRRLVKQFDDQITRPHIRRYYDWHMLFNEDESIKGDFTIDARGSSALLVRDIQNQAFLNLLAAAQSPIFGKYLDPQKLFEKALQAQHIDPEEVFKPADQLEKIREQELAAMDQPAPPPPQVQAAQIRAQTEVQRIQAEQKMDAIELNGKLELANREHQARMEELAMQREIRMMELAVQQKVSLETIKAQLAQIAIAERTRRDIFNAESHLKLATGSGI